MEHLLIFTIFTKIDKNDREFHQNWPGRGAGAGHHGRRKFDSRSGVPIENGLGRGRRRGTTGDGILASERGFSSKSASATDAAPRRAAGDRDGGGDGEDGQPQAIEGIGGGRCSAARRSQRGRE